MFLYIVNEPALEMYNFAYLKLVTKTITVNNIIYLYSIK